MSDNSTISRIDNEIGNRTFMAQTLGIFRYIVPDPNDRPEDRAFFTTPAAFATKDETLPLIDFRSSTELAQGPEGLDIQGFTFIKHQSALTSEELVSGRNVEDFYVQETEDLILKVTGGSRAVVQSVTFRRKGTEGADEEDIEGTSRVMRTGGDDGTGTSKELESPTGVRVTGRDIAAAWDPARRVHCDLTKKGMLDSVRYSKGRLADAAGSVLSRLSADELHLSDRPRLAAYSVWRPLRTVQRDPIACLDWRTTDKSELAPMGLRIPSDTGDYVVEQWAALPWKKPENHRWYWIPEQQPDNVAIIKFADTAESEKIAGGCIHGSPWVLGAEKESCRESVECRVYVFWD